MASVGGELKIKKKLYLGISYRYLSEVKNYYKYIKENRLTVFVSKKIKIKPVSFELRSLFQYELKNRIKADDALSKFNWRNKAKIKTKLFHFMDVFSAGEIFLFGEERFLSKYRLEIGAKKKFFKKSTLELSYLMDSNGTASIGFPTTRYILKTGLTIKFD